jgi:uncharacterized protein YjbI with pentapeptide repeats
MIEIKNWKNGEVIYTSETATSIKEAVEEAVKAKVSLEWAYLKKANLEEANLQYASLYMANLEEAYLKKANLAWANLYAVNLKKANLKKANLEGAYLKKANLQYANLKKANLYVAYLEGVNLPYKEITPIIEDIHQKVYEAASKPNVLDMNVCYTCETTHCRAGWVVTLAGEAGKKLEEMLGTNTAASLIYMASDPELDQIPDWFDSNEDALADMERLAEQEQTKGK